MRRGVPALAAIGLAAMSLAAACRGGAPDPAPKADAPAPEPAFSLTRSQTCDERGTERNAQNPPNGFLEAAAPFAFHEPGDPAIPGAGNYAAASAGRALALYRERDEIAAPVHLALFNRDAAALTAAFRRAADLADRTSRAGLVRNIVPPALGGRNAFEIEHLAPELAAHIAFLILTVDQDYRAFERRMESIQSGAFVASPDYRFREPGAPSAVGGRLAFEPATLVFMRAMIVYRLLKGDRAAAERAMLFLIEREAAYSASDYFFPYEARSLSRDLRRRDVRLDDLATRAAADVPRLARCSDFYALIVEWLDLESRVAILRGPQSFRGDVLRNARALRSRTPRDLIGPRYSAALTRIIGRLAGNPGN